MASTPLTLAETASVFGEMLTFRSLLDQTTDKRERKAMLAQKVEDMINTVVRQIAFYEFERKVHAERSNGELTSDRLGEFWLEVQAESLGPAIKLARGLRDLLDLYPALHPFALLRLRLCLRRLPGELALRRLPERRARLPGQVFRDAAAPAAPSIIPSCWRPSASTPPTRPSGRSGLAVIEGLIDELEALDRLTRALACWRRTV